MRRSLLAGAFVLFLAVIPVTLAAQIQECGRILENGIRDSYQLNSSSTYESMLASLLDMSEQQLASAKNSSNFGASIPLPLGDAFATLGLSSGSGKQRLSTIRSTYKQQGLAAINRSDFVWLTQQVVNQAIPAAWLRCIELTVDRKPQGVQIAIDDDPTRRFSVVLKWVQSSGAEQMPQIDRVTLNGLRPVGTSSVVDGATLPNLTERLLVLDRTDTAEATIAITFRSGHNDLFVRLPSQSARPLASRLAGTWVLSGLPPDTRFEMCLTNCATGPRVKVIQGPSVPGMDGYQPLGSSGGLMTVNGAKFVFADGGRASLHISGHQPGGGYGYGNQFPQTKLESVWFDYVLEPSALRIISVELDGKVKTTNDGGDENTVRLPFTLVGQDLLTMRMDSMTLYFTRQ